MASSTKPARRPFSESSVATKEVVRAVLGADIGVGTWFEAAQDADGQDAIRLIVVIESAAAENVEGGQLIAIISGVKDRLADLGEEREPIISFATFAEKPEVADD